MEHNYEIGRLLGRGSFAAVHLARHRKRRGMCALKLIDVSSHPHGVRQQTGSCNNSKDHCDNNIILLQLLQREIEIHSTSHHENIVQFVESFSYDTNNNQMLAMVLEYCPGGDLSNYFVRMRNHRKSKSTPLHVTFLSMEEIKHGISQILSALAYLHSRGIIHRDIKAGNVYLVPLLRLQNDDVQHAGEKQRCDDSPSLTSYTLKIGDFGLAVRMNVDEDWSECRTTVCGTPSCLAPEVVRGTVSGDGATGLHQNDNRLREFDDIAHQVQGYGLPADLWSVGCLLFTMIVGRNPFALPSPRNKDNHHRSNRDAKMARVAETINRVVREDWSLPAYICVDTDVESLLNQLLESRPRKRGTARGILAVHPFFRDAFDNAALVKVCEQKIGLLSIKEENNVHEKENIENCNDVHEEQVAHASKMIGPNLFGHEVHQLTKPPISIDMALIEGLHRLPTCKYKWKEGNSQITAFLLGRDGLVIQENAGRDGRWMHITSDGKGVFCGSLSGPIDRNAAKSDSLLSDDTEDVVRQAFQHAPTNFIRNENSNKPANHEPLGVLISPSNERDLRLYKVAERLARSVKSLTPKVILYLHSPKFKTPVKPTLGHCNRKVRNSFRTFAKLILMENAPNANIEVAFVDGVTFQLRKMGQAKAKMIVCWKDNSVPRKSIFGVNPDMVLTCEFRDLVLCYEELVPETRTLVQTLSEHFRVVQSASKACMRIEKQYEQQSMKDQKYPISLRMAAAAWDRSKWITLDDDAFEN